MAAMPTPLVAVRLTTPQGERLFHHRGTPADVAVVQQCFIQPQYVCPGVHGGSIAACYHAIRARGHTPYIVDLGANIGASAVWFAARYPGSRIAAFEPHPGNFRLLERNCQGLDVDLHRAAICGTPTAGILIDPGMGEWGYRLATSGTTPSAGIPVDTIVLGEHLATRLVPPLEPFILKIDIEGAEIGLFDHHQPLLDRFPAIILEPHDWMLPGIAVSRGFFRFHAAFERDFVAHGENVFSIASPAMRVSAP